MKNRYDIAVIGGGIAGASLAAAVSPYRSVLILEGESQAGYHSTGRSAAVFSCINGSNLTQALSRASADFFYDPPDGFAAAPLLRRRGCMWVAAEPDSAKLDEIAVQHADHGLLQSLDRREAQALCPVLNPRSIHGALYEKDGADIDVDLIHQGYLRQMRRNGGALASDIRIEKIARKGGEWALDVNGATIAATVLVNAAGAWADEVAALVGAQKLGLTPLQRTAALTAPPEGVNITDWPLVVEVNESLYFKPDAGLILFSPADASERTPYDAQPDDLDIAIAVDRLEKMTTLKVKTLKSKWAGLRTFAPDRAPVIGYDPEIEGFFWHAGLGGSGIQTSPAISAFAASELLGEPPPAWLADSGVVFDAMRRKRPSASKARQNPARRASI